MVSRQALMALAAFAAAGSSALFEPATPRFFGAERYYRRAGHAGVGTKAYQRAAAKRRAKKARHG